MEAIAITSPSATHHPSRSPPPPLQVGLTIVSAYSCYYVAEAVLGASGVLAVVTLGITLAATFWPIVISR